MAKKEEKYPHPEQLKLYEKLIATIPVIEKKGAAIPYTSQNGNMFSYMADDGTLAQRLPEGAREKFLEKYNTRLRVAYGIVQKEYVVVPFGLLANTAELKPYMQQSWEYVQKLKAKPPKKNN